MEKSGIRVARQLVRLAKELVAISMTRNDFKEYSKQYGESFGGETLNEKLFDIFKNRKQLRRFKKQKRRTYPNLKEFLPADKLKSLLDSKMMCIVSAGRNGREIDDPGLITDRQVEQRYERLRRFLESLELPYYEVLGSYFGNQEKSYIVDLTNDGEYLNDSAAVSSNLQKIRAFCNNDSKQDCIIEGIGHATVFQFSDSYVPQDEDNPVNDPYTKPESGRSTVFTQSPARYRRHNPSSVKDKTDSFSYNYGDFDNPVPGTRY